MHLQDVGNKLRNKAVELRKKADWYEGVANDVDIVADEIENGHQSLSVDVMPAAVLDSGGIQTLVFPTKKTKRKLSHAGLAAMKRGQKARWARWHEKNDKVVKKGHFSAAGLAAMKKANKARWARWRKEQKTAK